MAMKAPSDELLRLYCELVCDSGYLLELDRAERSREQDALCFLDQRKRSASLYAFLLMRQRQSERFHVWTSARRWRISS